MAILSRPPEHPSMDRSRIGVIIANLGTPDGYDYRSMRRYLSEFLSDKRVIDTPGWRWQPILQGIILSTRPQKSGAAYKAIWDKAQNDSPLRVITRAQRDKLAPLLSEKFGPDIMIEFAMRYGEPSIASVIEKLTDEGCDRILFFPLYPQYSASTSATANDAAFRALMNMRWQPALRIVPPYFSHPSYVSALAQSITNALEDLPSAPSKLLLSYHGIPVRYRDEGDPYFCHCHKTTRLVSEAAGLDEDFVETVFQSQFGPEEWVGPAEVETLKDLARLGHKHVAMAAPCFSADGLETLFEICVEMREEFLEAGGERLDYIPCLNDDEAHIRALGAIIAEALGGWV